MATERQLAANRANAKLSTGPTTEAGKAQSRWNAVKDGLHARLAILPGESAEEFEALRDGVMEAMRPQGVLELMLAGRLITLLWRQRRGLAAEQNIYAALDGEAGVRTAQALGCGTKDEAPAGDGGAALHQAVEAPLDRLTRWEDRLDRAIRHTHRLLDREQRIRTENS